MRFAPLTAAAAFFLILAGAAGCDTGNEPTAIEPADDPAVVDEPLEPAVEDEAAEEYAIRGVITAVNREEPSVTVDHEEIEGLMKAMTMKFRVEDAQLLEGVEEGDQIEGELVKRDDQYVIVELSEAAE